MDILKSLDQSPAVSNYEVLTFRTWTGGGYLKMTLQLVDGSTLHAREYVDESERHYSFHWQDEKSQVLVRWDNAPHHPDLPSFPHHRHEGAKVTESKPATLADVLETLETMLL